MSQRTREIAVITPEPFRAAALDKRLVLSLK
jgi:hypothetical protein